MGFRRRRKRGPRRPPSDAGDLAWAFVRRHVPSGQVRVIRIRELWDRIATERIAHRTWPSRVDGGELSVAVQDNQWLHELAYLRQDLLDRLHELAPEANIQSIRLRLGAIPPRRPKAPKPVQPRRPTLPEDAPSETMEVLRGIRDPELRDAAAAARLTLGQEREPGPRSKQ